MKAKDIKIGADPEFFLLNTTTKKNESCHTFMKGDKKNPYPLNHGAVQVDGTAVEFNIEATSNPADFASNVQRVLDQIREMVPKQYDFQFKPHVIYDADYFSTLPLQCVELGCDPDFNATTGKINPKPEPKGEYKTMRTGAGHIHIGWTNGKSLDDTSHSFDAQHVAGNLHRLLVNGGLTRLWDKDNVRQKLYGGNAAYRPKSYGCELRSPSNAWLNHPKLWPWLAETCQAATAYLYDTGRYINYPTLESAIRDAQYYKTYYPHEYKRYYDGVVDELDNRTKTYSLKTYVSAYNAWCKMHKLTVLPPLDHSMFNPGAI